MSIQIVFFGTGSGRPMPKRNVSGMAMMREGEVYLFDCGEYSQVRMMDTPVKPGRIEAIFISHFHGDHVNGLPGMLGSLGLNQREKMLEVYGPVGMKQWFGVMHQLGILRVDRFAKINEIEEAGSLYSTDEFDIVAAPLDHRIRCYGFAMVEHSRPGRFNLERAQELKIPPCPLYGRLQKGHKVTLPDGRVIEPSEVMGASRRGLKVAYCTDTRPSPRTVELARDADLLIHEATYPAGMEQEAHQRGHSTSADAARIAKEANVKRLVLTHFSQQFASTDPFLPGAQKIFPNTVAARDLSEFVVEHDD